ncbi:MAG: crossover junction endodeoxyribonuclease RuvC [Flavobacteriales bacterium]|nr:crossover junction endodeoxyribonuclease RuvC [Flavobacteriales bacterium]
MGYGIIKVKNNTIELVSFGVIHLHKLANHALKLKRIFERVSQLIEEHNPDEMALEAPFFGKNVQSMLKLGRAQGVAMSAGLVREVPIFEYSPKRIKQAVTGSGSASKEQVAQMLKTVVKLKEIPKEFDSTDALAVAVCHHFQRSSPLSGLGGKSSWKNFLKENPDRKV